MSKDFFDIFDLPKKLNINHNELKKRFVVLSKKYKKEKDKRLKVIEEAYETLKERISRVDYLIESAGLKVRRERKKIPTAFVDLAQNINKIIPELEQKKDLAVKKLKTLHQDILKEFSTISTRLADIEKEWDENALKERTDRILRRLKRTVEDFHFVKKLEQKVRDVLN